MNHCTKDQLIAFESKIKDLWEAGELPYLIHLSGGNEDQLIEFFDLADSSDWFFSTHRNHYHYLLAGGSPDRLEHLIRTGNSMFVFDKSINFLSSSVLAGTCCIAAGVAWQLKQEGSKSRVWCFVGDGAEAEGHFAEAVAFVHGHGLPCTFILENNDRSVDTDCATRLPRGSGIQWPDDCVEEYYYTPTWPHAGSGCKHKIEFKPK